MSNKNLDLEDEVDAFAQTLRDKHPGLQLDYYYDDRHNILLISRIIVPKEKRNQGIGTDVMRNLMDFAKSKGLKTALTPTPELGSGKDRLKKFYRGFGFKKNKDQSISETMMASIKKISSRDSWKLFVDDIRYPRDNSNWVIARTVQEAKDLILSKGCPDYISFDHDIDPNETGYDLAKWMTEQDMNGTIQIPDDFKYHVHSANPVGKKNIEGILNSYLRFKANAKDKQ